MYYLNHDVRLISLSKRKKTCNFVEKMLGIRFFKLPKARQYNYQPVFYDPEKEKFQQNKDTSEDEQKYKTSLRGSFRRQRSKSKQQRELKNANIRLLVILGLLILLALYFFFSV